MADLIYAISASLDGYIADENGNFDWVPISDDAHAFFNDIQRSVGTFLCGRGMYETMRVWDAFVLDDLPAVQRDFAEAWRATDKIVYSSTLDAVTEPRTRLERAFAPDEIRSMKATADGDLSIGGAGLAAEAIRVGLVDRYVLRWSLRSSVEAPRPSPTAARVDLALNTTRRFDDGTVALDYSLR
jgi:dihydrofolate reductase